MFTQAGLEWLAERLLAGAEGATIVVRGLDDQEATTPVTSTERIDTAVHFRGVFGENEANFEWTSRALVIGGEEIDLDVEDMGRKVQGAIWNVEVVLSLIEE